MPLPKQVKPTLPLVTPKTLSPRREELLQYINKDGTYLPKSVLHEDLDKGMLEFVKNDLSITVDGKLVPTIDRIITTQNWSQYVETFTFIDLDYNPNPPFITLVRSPDVKYGTNPSLQYTIPNRKQFYYASVPTWNGNVQGVDIYTIPQPVPVDINYSVKLICNRMRELHQLNKVILQKFSSRQAYTFIKGQYVPIVLNNITDESEVNISARKYYSQSYDFTMLGYLIDEEEFEVKPGIERVLQVFETSTNEPKKRKEPSIKNIAEFDGVFYFVSGNTTLSDIIDYRVDLDWVGSENIETYDIFINGNYYGSDLSKIQLNTNDILRVDVIKTDINLEAKLIFTMTLV